jgi:hypothetical protein
MGNNSINVLYENEKALYELFTSTGEHTEEEKESFIKNLILGRELANKNPSLTKLRKQQKKTE